MRYQFRIRRGIKHMSPISAQPQALHCTNAVKIPVSTFDSGAISGEAVFRSLDTNALKALSRRERGQQRSDTFIL